MPQLEGSCQHFTQEYIEEENDFFFTQKLCNKYFNFEEAYLNSVDSDRLQT